ncbi:hypothetical protein IKF33_03050 [Candidatus Saccharibacteria bacterium]|nr:hypothetical protein [Candidatus Saccharibacteria bacterium]
MNLIIQQFADNWNEEHPDFLFQIEGPANKPFEVNVRYPVGRCYGYFINNFKRWSDFVSEIDEKSKGILIVTSGKELFARGIIEIKVACQSPDFDPVVVTEILAWIGKKLSPHKKASITTRVSER